MGEKPFSQTVTRESSPLRGRNHEQDLDHKGGAFLLRASWVKEEKRREIGQGEDGGQREDRHRYIGNTI